MLLYFQSYYDRGKVWLAKTWDYFKHSDYNDETICTLTDGSVKVLFCSSTTRDSFEKFQLVTIKYTWATTNEKVN